MNIWEINGGTPKYWTVLALGLGTLILSLPVLIWVFLNDDDKYRTLNRVARGDKDTRSSGNKSLLGIMGRGNIVASPLSECENQSEGNDKPINSIRKRTPYFRANREIMAQNRQS